MTTTMHWEGVREASAWLSKFKVANLLVRASDLSAPLVVEALRKEAPYMVRGSDFAESGEDYRHLRDSIATVRHSTVGTVERVFTSDVPQAWFTIDGTKPHDISNRGETGRTPSTPWRSATGGQRTVLHWVSRSGLDVFVPASAQPVHHPGNAPNPWNRRAWDAVRPLVVGRFVAELGKGIHG